MEAFSDTFPEANGTTPWPVAKWTRLTSATSGDSEVWNNRGSLILYGNTTYHVMYISKGRAVQEQDSILEINKTDNNLTDTTRGFGAVFMQSGTNPTRTAVPQNGFRMQFTMASSSVAVTKYVAGVSTNLGTVSFTNGSVLYIRFRYKDGRAMVKVWSGTISGEPDAWGLDVATAAPAAGQLVVFGYGIATSTGALYTDYDNIMVDDAYTGFGLPL